MPSDYTPLHTRFEINRDVLHEGVPVWMADDLEGILRHLLSKVPTLEGALQRTFQLDIRQTEGRRRESLLAIARDDGEMMLDFLNFALAHLVSLDSNQAGLVDAVVDLKKVLDEGDSVWQVTWNGEVVGLQRRVELSVHERAEAEMAAATTVSGYLRESWKEAYGRDGDPDRSMKHAVYALEAALCPLVIPKDHKPSLGKALATLRDTPHKIRLPLETTKDGQTSASAVVAMVDTVWRTHQRHVDADGQASGNSADEAECALHVALTVAHLVREGLLSREE